MKDDSTNRTDVVVKTVPAPIDWKRILLTVVVVGGIVGIGGYFINKRLSEEENNDQDDSGTTPPVTNPTQPTPPTPSTPSQPTPSAPSTPSTEEPEVSTPPWSIPEVTNKKLTIGLVVGGIVLVLLYIVWHFFGKKYYNIARQANVVFEGDTNDIESVLGTELMKSRTEQILSETLTSSAIKNLPKTERTPEIKKDIRDTVQAVISKNMEESGVHDVSPPKTPSEINEYALTVVDHIGNYSQERGFQEDIDGSVNTIGKRLDPAQTGAIITALQNLSVGSTLSPKIKNKLVKGIEKEVKDVNEEVGKVTLLHRSRELAKANTQLMLKNHPENSELVKRARKNEQSVDNKLSRLGVKVAENESGEVSYMIPGVGGSKDVRFENGGWSRALKRPREVVTSIEEEIEKPMKQLKTGISNEERRLKYLLGKRDELNIKARDIRMRAGPFLSEKEGLELQKEASRVGNEMQEVRKEIEGIQGTYKERKRAERRMMRRLEQDMKLARDTALETEMKAIYGEKAVERVLSGNRV